MLATWAVCWVYSNTSQTYATWEFTWFFDGVQLLPLIRNVVFSTFTFRSFSANFNFQVDSLFLTSLRDSASIIKSSASRSCLGQPVWSSQDNASKLTKINKRRKTKPWWMPILPEYISFHSQSTLTILSALSYMALTSVIIHSDISTTHFSPDDLSRDTVRCFFKVHKK